MGLLDLPAMLDYILNLTKKEKLTYIGHSQGCAQFFALCSLQPDFCEKRIKGMLAFGPAIYLDNGTANILTIAAKFKFDSFLNEIGIKNLLESPEKVNVFTRLICNNFTSLCKIVDSLIADENPLDNNQDRIKVFFSHYPSGMSTRSIHHFGEIIRTKKFVNIRSDNNEEYPINNINVPLYLFVGNDDRLADSMDCRRARDALNKNFVKFYKEYDGMGHMSFFMTNGKPTFIKDALDMVKDIESYA